MNPIDKMNPVMVLAFREMHQSITGKLSRGGASPARPRNRAMVHAREDIRMQSTRKLTVEFVEDSPKAVVAGDELTVTNSGELPRMKSTEFAELRSPRANSSRGRSFSSTVVTVVCLAWIGKASIAGGSGDRAS
jgi:hypothetical protein